MRQPACKRLADLSLRLSVALAVVVAPCLLGPGNVTKLVSAAYAGNGNNGGNGNGGNSGSGGGSNSGSAGGSNSGSAGGSNSGNAGGNSNNSNAGGGNPNAGPGNNSGKGHANPGGKNSYTNAATGDTLSIDGNKITVVHRNGMKEEVQNGRFEMTDAQGRTIIERQATEEDLNRLLSL
ncbi:Glycine-rich cell wall protein [Mesorhizobium sp. ORS 3359]|nr:Glycine-rich cell wall protein [Mesorhizobium sp. ORS 3359]